MSARCWVSALAVSVAAGTLVAVVMTFLDWQLNPGGIFHDELGTRWTVVAETAASWFFPVASAAAVLSAAGFIVAARFR